MSVLHKRIESLCEERGITGYRLCKDIGMSPNTMTELRAGRRDGISAKNANKIAEYFGVSVAYLLGTEEKPATTMGDGLSDEDVFRHLESMSNSNLVKLMADAAAMLRERGEL